jgi:hypothetical protein
VCDRLWFDRSDEGEQQTSRDFVFTLLGSLGYVTRVPAVRYMQAVAESRRTTNSVGI